MAEGEDRFAVDGLPAVEGMSEVEIAEAVEAFRLFDQDGDGCVACPRPLPLA